MEAQAFYWRNRHQFRTEASTVCVCVCLCMCVRERRAQSRQQIKQVKVFASNLITVAATEEEPMAGAKCEQALA